MNLLEGIFHEGEGLLPGGLALACQTLNLR